MLQFVPVFTITLIDSKKLKVRLLSMMHVKERVNLGTNRSYDFANRVTKCSLTIGLPGLELTALVPK